MTYLKVLWKKKNINYPIVIFSELLEDRYEARKIEKYNDGTYGYAFNNHEINDSILAECATPSIRKIAEDLEFKPIEITKEEFEEIWHTAILSNNKVIGDSTEWH